MATKKKKKKPFTFSGKVEAFDVKKGKPDKPTGTKFFSKGKEISKEKAGRTLKFPEKKGKFPPEGKLDKFKGKEIPKKEEKPITSKVFEGLSGRTAREASESQGAGLQAGTLPITGVGAAAATAPALAGKVAPKVVKGRKVIENILKGSTKKGKTAADFAIDRELAARRIARLAKISDSAAIRMINTYNKMSQPQIMKILTSKPVKKVGALGTAVVGADTIWAWYALDNAATGLKFMIPDAKNALELNTRTEEEIMELFSEAEIVYDLALAKVDSSARWNPLTWGARKLIVTGARFDKKEYDLAKDNFMAELAGDRERQAEVDADRQRREEESGFEIRPPPK